MVTNEPVEFEKQSIEMQDFGKIYRPFYRNVENIYIYLKLMKENRKVLACNIKLFNRVGCFMILEYVRCIR